MLPNVVAFAFWIVMPWIPGYRTVEWLLVVSAPTACDGGYGPGPHLPDTLHSRPTTSISAGSATPAESVLTRVESLLTSSPIWPQRARSCPKNKLRFISILLFSYARTFLSSLSTRAQS